MYERFTDRACKVMQLAQYEALRFNHEYIGTEHLILGLITEGHGVAANVLKNLAIDPLKVRREVESIVQAGPGGERAGSCQLPHTPRSQKVIAYAIEEATQFKHTYVGTEHLLLGLIREQEGIAAQVLMNLGLYLETARAEVMKLLGIAIPPQSEEATPHITFDQSRTGVPQPKLIRDEQLQMIRDRIRHLTEQKEVFIAAQDFTLAARCRDEAEALDRLLACYEWYCAWQ